MLVFVYTQNKIWIFSIDVIRATEYYHDVADSTIIINQMYEVRSLSLKSPFLLYLIPERRRKKRKKNQESFCNHYTRLKTIQYNIYTYILFPPNVPGISIFLVLEFFVSFIILPVYCYYCYLLRASFGFGKRTNRARRVRVPRYSVGRESGWNEKKKKNVLSRQVLPIHNTGGVHFQFVIYSKSARAPCSVHKRVPG